MVRTYVAAALFAGLTLAAVPADAQMLRDSKAPATLTHNERKPAPRLEQHNVPLGEGRWGTSTPLGRPCYAGMITQPCSTPGPSISIELPSFRIRK